MRIFIVSWDSQYDDDLKSNVTICFSAADVAQTINALKPSRQHKWTLPDKIYGRQLREEHKRRYRSWETTQDWSKWATSPLLGTLSIEEVDPKLGPHDVDL